MVLCGLQRGHVLWILSGDMFTALWTMTLRSSFTALWPTMQLADIVRFSEVCSNEQLLSI